MSKKQQLATRIAHLQLKLQPLVPLPTGDPHPDFPRTILAYHLLTEADRQSNKHGKIYPGGNGGTFTGFHPDPGSVAEDKIDFIHLKLSDLK